MCKEVAPKLQAPIVLFQYFNPMLRCSVRVYCERAKDAGAAGGPRSQPWLSKISQLAACDFTIWHLHLHNGRLPHPNGHHGAPACPALLHLVRLSAAPMLGQLHAVLPALPQVLLVLTSQWVQVCLCPTFPLRRRLPCVKLPMPWAWSWCC